MLNNSKLNRRIKKIFGYLRENWDIKPYRIAVETKIPHSSLKYMMDGKFEWKLNHLLSITDFLNRNNAIISLSDLLNFDDKKSLAEIMNTKKADFTEVVNSEPGRRKKSVFPKIRKPANIQKESEEITKEISEIIKESPLFKKHRISFNLKVSNNNFDYHQDLNFLNGKKLKD
jgi:hypothetical protein